MGFMGWTPVKSGGRWYATKVVESGRYGSTGLVRKRRLLDLSGDAPKSRAEQEIVRLYRRGVLE